MTGVIVLAVIAEWAALALAGKKLAARLANPETWVLPLLMGGVLGVVVMVAASYPWQERRAAMARDR